MTHISQSDALRSVNVLKHIDTNTLPRLLANHNHLGGPQHPRSVALSLLSFLLFHTCSTDRQIMQQDRQLGIPPPSPCLAFLTLCLCYHSFSPPLSLTLSLSYPGVTDYYSADGCREMTHNTSELEQAAHTRQHTPAPPPTTSFFSSRVFSTDTAKSSPYRHSAKNPLVISFPLVSVAELEATTGMKSVCGCVCALWVQNMRFSYVQCYIILMRFKCFLRNRMHPSPSLPLNNELKGNGDKLTGSIMKHASLI